MSSPRSWYAVFRNRRLWRIEAGDDDLFGIMTESGDVLRTEADVSLAEEHT